MKTKVKKELPIDELVDNKPDLDMEVESVEQSIPSNKVKVGDRYYTLKEYDDLFGASW